ERVEVDSANFDITLTVVENGGRIAGSVEYAGNLFERESALRLLGHLRRLFEGMAADRECRVSNLSLLTEQEQEEVLAWNRTAVEYASEKCVHQLFEAQVDRAPDRIAGIIDGAEISYGELNRRANQLGNYLRKRSIGAEVRVGICLERGLDML